MGRMALEGMLEADASKDQVLSWHLTSNHYPPVPLGMVPVCKQAIEHANTARWHKDVDLPEGVTWRGQDHAPVHAIIEEFHLTSFLDCDDD